jgi:membrane fusion protein (multidrug efflux system)
MSLKNRYGRFVMPAVAVVGLFFLGCAEDTEPPANLGLAPPVMVSRVVVRDVIDRITATGQLVAKAEATIAAQIPGQVTAISVQEGEAVSAGQILLEIDPQRRELELASAEAHLAEASAQVVETWRAMDRIQNLNKRDAASQSRLDEARTALKLAHSRKGASEARVGLARRALADASVRTPFAGLVARRSVSVGEYLSVGLPLFEIVTLSPIEAEFSVAEVDSGRVRPGQSVEVSLAPFPEERFAAIVTVVSPTIDSLTRTLRVKAELPNADSRLRPGLFAHIELGVSERGDVLMVPEEALIQRAEGTALYRMVGTDRVQRVHVTTGVFVDGWVEVRGKLDAGDRVVVRGQANLLDGGVVSIRTRDGRPVDEPQVAVPASSLASGVDG